ncbi:sensor histidine kinase [Agromyces sp. M3QZ16-3]|uniref:sensor histidine kinase n=1 Tax=Agromyces sp. M3QZ16-3 TaxID=3447585 RepID=UPI003F68BFB3
MGTRSPGGGAPSPDVREQARRTESRRVAAPHWPWALLVVASACWLVELVLVLVVGEFGELPWLAASAATLVAAMVVMARRPRHPLAPWFTLLSLSGVSALAGVGIAAMLQAEAAPAGLALVNLVSQLAVVVAAIGAAHVVGLFPDGSATPGERGTVTSTWALAAVPPILFLLSPTITIPFYYDAPGIPSPFALPFAGIDPAVGSAVGDLLGLIPVAIGAVVLIVRYARATPSQRQPMRWMFVPIACLLIAAATQLLIGSGEPRWLISVLWISTGIVFAVSIALGLLQPARLNPDRVIRGTLMYGLLWVVIAAAYVLAGSVVGAAAGTLLPLGWAVALAMVAAVAFQPLRTRIERLADRRVFGARADPSQLVVGLGQTLAGTYDLDALLPRIAATLEEGMGLTWARVRLEPADADDAAREGTDPDGAEADPGPPVLVVPIEVDGERVGRIECGPKSTGLLSSSDTEVIATFAGQAGLAVRNVRMAQQLAEQARLLTESRARLVRAQEAERRRIERNIHDGVQQDLTALIGLAGQARQAHDRDTGDVDEDLDAIQQGLRRVLADVRDLAQGIHPAVLSDRGLLAAVEALAARHPVPVTVRADARLRDRRLAEDLEGAGYFVVAEALTNSLKHASAQHIDVALSLDGAALAIRVHDDGVGIGAVHPLGNGLAGLAARVAAVGGRLDVSGSAGAGTTVTADFSPPTAAGAR